MSRKLIRDKVFELLNLNTSFGNRVYRCRKVPFDENGECNQGVVLIYLEKESSEVFNDTPRTYRRSLSLSIAIVKSLTPEDIEKIEDQIEVVSLQVEKIMGKNETLGELASDVTFEGYEFLDSDDGELRTGAIKLTYSIEYYIDVGLEEADLGNLVKSHVELKQGANSDFQFDVNHVP